MSDLGIVLGLLATLGGDRSQPAKVANPIQEDALIRVEQALEMWDVDSADAEVQRLLAESPRSAVVGLLAARVRFHQGRYDEAIAAVEAAARDASDPELEAHAREFAEFVRPLAELDRRFVVEESEHFTVHFVDGPDRVLAARAIVALEGSYRVLGEEFGVYPKAKVRVEIFPDAESFQRASTLSKSEIETSGTIALCKFNRLMMMSPRLILRGFTWCDTLSHEYVHYVLWRRNGPTIPIWLHEGIAKYEETRWSGAPPSALSLPLKQVLKAAIDSDDFVTFDEMHPSFAKLPTPRKVALASAEVLSVIHFVMGQGGKEQLGRMLDALRDGADWRRMFEVALGQPFETFWKAWRDHLALELKDVQGVESDDQKLVELRDPMVPPRPIGDDAEADESAPDGDMAAVAGGRYTRLGDLLAARGFDRAAAVEYERAVAREDTVSVVLLNRLGATYRRIGDWSRATDAYRRSLDRDPEYAPTLTNLGLLHRERGNAKEAVDHLEASARVNPFDPRIHQALAEVYGFLGRKPEQDRAERELAILQAQ